jgi:hypothetical protein
MKLYEKFGDSGFHSSILTTFGIDFDAFENIALPRLRGAGCRNNILIADKRMLTYALNGDSVLPRSAGRWYRIQGGAVSGGGVFHPKLHLQFGRDKGRMMIGSANITSAGLAGNLELVSQLDCDGNESGEQQLVRQAYAYVCRVIGGHKSSASLQLDWLEERTPWLHRAAPSSDPASLKDGTLAALLAAGEEAGIGQRFAELVDSPVTRLLVISPYWDEKLSALRHLCEQLSPGEVSILLDSQATSLPVDALDSLPPSSLFERGAFKKGRFIHAKMIVAETQNADHVLMGSANCTIAALGNQGYGGANEEVCLYRRLPSGSVVEALGLVDALSPDRRIEPHLLKLVPREEEIPLDELAASNPGEFECMVDTLTWRPATRFKGGSSVIELLDTHWQTIACSLRAVTSTDETRRYQIQEAEVRPAFARIVLPDGLRSGIAIVSLVDQLQMAMRERHSRQVDRALAELDGDTQATLAIIEVHNILERIAQEDRGAQGGNFIARGRAATGDAEEKTYKKLSYAEFLAGRRPYEPASKGGHSSLAGSSASLVRGILNRIVGMGDSEKSEEIEDSAKLAKAFDLGDETANPEALIASGEEVPIAQTDPEKERSDAIEQRRLESRRATKAQIVEAVRALCLRMKQRQAAGTLDNQDVLRLRALLMVVCSASWSEGAKSKKELTLLQVLPSEGDTDCWPVLIGRLLFAVFGGNEPAIRRIYLLNEHDQIPIDVLECWATCYWCLQACLAAPVSKAQHARLQKFLMPLAEPLYKLSLPTREEVLGVPVETVMHAMSNHYAQALGIDPSLVSSSHQRTVASLFGG